MSFLQKLLTVKEAAHYLRVCDNTIYRMVRRGELPAMRFGRCVRIAPAELDRLGQIPDRK